MTAKVNGFAPLFCPQALEGDKMSSVTTPPTEAAMPANADIFIKFRRDNSAAMRRSRASFFSLMIVPSSSFTMPPKESIDSSPAEEPKRSHCYQTIRRGFRVTSPPFTWSSITEGIRF